MFMENQEKVLLTAKDVSELLNCKLSYAYHICRELNKELEAAGKLVIKGRINRRYLLKKLDVSDI